MSRGKREDRKPQSANDWVLTYRSPAGAGAAWLTSDHLLKPVVLQVLCIVGHAMHSDLLRTESSE